MKSLVMQETINRRTNKTTYYKATGDKLIRVSPAEYRAINNRGVASSCYLTTMDATYIRHSKVVHFA